MQIFLNGVAHTVTEELTLSELLLRFNIQTSRIAIEKNRQIIPKSLYDTTTLTANDQLEIIQAIGGG